MTVQSGTLREELGLSHREESLYQFNFPQQVNRYNYGDGRAKGHLKNGIRPFPCFSMESLKNYFEIVLVSKDKNGPQKKSEKEPGCLQIPSPSIPSAKSGSYLLAFHLFTRRSSVSKQQENMIQLHKNDGCFLKPDVYKFIQFYP